MLYNLSGNAELDLESGAVIRGAPRIVTGCRRQMRVLRGMKIIE